MINVYFDINAEKDIEYLSIYLQYKDLAKSEVVGITLHKQQLKDLEIQSVAHTICQKLLESICIQANISPLKLFENSDDSKIIFEKILDKLKEFKP